MPKRYIEVRVRTGRDFEEFLGLFDHRQMLGAWENDGVLHLYWPEDRWDASVLDTLRSAAQGPQDGITVARVPDQDWNLAWTQSIRPLRVGRRILIRQSWNPGDPSPEDIELVIDPKRAFGTGFHPTTQLMIEWLEQKVRGGESVLDAGTGSGILAMAALRLGAGSALGIDKDPVAIECALGHARDNGFGPELRLRTVEIAKLEPGRYDLVLANLDRNTLLRHSCHLAHRLNACGTLLVAGITPEDYDDIRQAFADGGCHVRERRDRGEWTGLVLMNDEVRMTSDE